MAKITAKICKNREIHHKIMASVKSSHAERGSEAQYCFCILFTFRTENEQHYRNRLKQQMKGHNIGKITLIPVIS